MALPESAFQKPYWIRYIEGPTLSRKLRAEFDYMNYAYNPRGRSWRIQPQPGYNAQNPTIIPDRVNLSNDVPFIRAR
jgi:hypothetical protein